jgi:hypothetical protein
MKKNGNPMAAQDFKRDPYKLLGVKHAVEMVGSIEEAERCLLYFKDLHEMNGKQAKEHKEELARALAAGAGFDPPPRTAKKKANKKVDKKAAKAKKHKKKKEPKEKLDPELAAGAGFDPPPRG